MKTLPHDVARCDGISPDKNAFIPQCGHCLRRTSEFVGVRMVWMMPPAFDEKCLQRIGEDE
jgi:hypothetical protein